MSQYQAEANSQCCSLRCLYYTLFPYRCLFVILLSSALLLLQLTHLVGTNCLSRTDQCLPYCEIHQCCISIYHIIAYFWNFCDLNRKSCSTCRRFYADSKAQLLVIVPFFSPQCTVCDIVDIPDLTCSHDNLKWLHESEKHSHCASSYTFLSSPIPL